jgi:hypothetical protein
MPEQGTPAVPWIEREMRMSLRWWQRLKLVRRLEHRADGTLCFREIVSSGPRRIGKSVELRGHALWRVHHGYLLFGEEQVVIHTGSDMAICREIQRGAWRWAEDKGWVVTRNNNNHGIEAPGGRWLVRSQDAVYGYDIMLALVDEGWNVKPDTVSEGLEPATMERQSPQIDKTSTAHRRATSLMRLAISDAMTQTDPRTLLLLWGALLGADSSDRAVWRAASPHWSTDREQLMEAKYRKALAGEEDPELDDPDPMKGFESQYLNIWRLAERVTIGNPVITAADWKGLRGAAPDRPADAVAVEAWYADGVCVARAWRPPAGGPVAVSVTDFPDIPAAAAELATYGLGRPALVGAALTDHAAWRMNGVRVTKMSDSTRSQVGDLIRYLGERGFRHDGGTELSSQVLALRTSPGSDGPRIRSMERADGIKAAMWAVAAASNGAGSGVDTVIVVDV